MVRSAVNSSWVSDYPWLPCKYYYPDRSSSEGLYVLFFTYFWECLVGAPLNLWLLVHIIKNRSQSGGVLHSDFYPLHLSLTHLLFYLVLVPLMVNHVTWESGTVFSVLSVLNAFMLVMKPLLYCLVCVERYLAVVRPLLYLRLKNCSYHWVSLSCAWCIYLLVCFISVFISRSIFSLSAFFLCVLVIDVFCSLSILRALRQAPPGDGRGDLDSSGKVRGEMKSVKRKAFVTVLILQGALCLNYVPLLLTLLLSPVVPPDTHMCQVQMLALSAAFGGSYLQPLFYLHKLGKLSCKHKNIT